MEIPARKSGRPPSRPAGLPPADLGKAPCCEEHLWKMPVFVPRSRANLDARSLHASYHPNAGVYELALNKRATRVLDALGIRTVGELLTTPRETLEEQWGCGSSTLAALHGELKRLLLDRRPGQEAKAADFSSFKALVKSLVRMTTGAPKDVDVLEKRFGVSEQGRWSLGRIGQGYGLTRERIRQIEKAGLERMSMRARRKALSDFWQTVVDIVGSPGQPCALDRLSRELTGRYNWPDPPDARGLAMLISLCPDLRVDEKDGTVWRW